MTRITRTRRSGHAARAALALLVAVIAGCASDSRWTYEKARVSPAQLDKDMTACRKVSASRGAFRIFQEDKVDREAFNRCMTSRGYEVKPAPP